MHTASILPLDTEGRRGESPKYLVISPVKDEEPYVEHTLKSMVRQSVKPVRWIIVDDGSGDRTPDLLERYAKQHSFIHVIRRGPGEARGPGPTVVRAFNQGYESGKAMDYDFVVKLDCDVSFEADYFERLLENFRKDPSLGIASGVYLESRDGGDWAEVAMPAYHAAGPCKIVRRSCFEQIGGFVAARGWDTVDEIRAMALGWRTGHVSEHKMRHWKPEGSGIGALRTSCMHGEVYYNTGGGHLFFALKFLHRLTRRPWVISGLALLWGYVRSALRRNERLVTHEEARLYRSLLNARIAGKLRQSIGIRN